MIYSRIGRKMRIKFIGPGAFLSIFITVISLMIVDISPSFGQDEVSISGITEAIRDVKLSLSVAGTISTIFFKEGFYVQKGECILELENRIESLEVQRRKLIWESKAELNAAEDRIQTLKTLVESNRKLFESTKSVSREELDKMELDYKLAVSEKKRLQVEEEKQRLEYEMALENLTKKRLESPINGIVIKLLLDEGERCEPEQPIVRVVDKSRCLLVSNVEETIGRTLRKGQSMELKIKTGTKSVIKKGTIAFVSPVVDPASGLLEVKTEFDNRNGEIRPGVSGYMIFQSSGDEI